LQHDFDIYYQGSAPTEIRIAQRNLEAVLENGRRRQKQQRVAADVLGVARGNHPRQGSVNYL